MANPPNILDSLRNRFARRPATAPTHVEPSPEPMPAALRPDPWQDMYECTDLSIWRARVQEHGLDPVRWVELPTNAEKCTPSCRVHSRSPLRWCLEMLSNDCVRLAALQAWSEVGARPQPELDHSATLPAWPSSDEPAGPPPPQALTCPIWQLTRSAQEEDMVRRHAGPHWGQKDDTGTAEKLAREAVEHSGSSMQMHLKMQNDLLVAGHANPAWFSARSAEWMKHLLANLPSHPESTQEINKGLRYRLLKMDDPSFDAGTELLLARVPELVDHACWGAWVEFACRHAERSPESPVALQKHNFPRRPSGMSALAQQLMLQQQALFMDTMKIKLELRENAAPVYAPSPRLEYPHLPFAPERIPVWADRLRSCDNQSESHLLWALLEKQGFLESCSEDLDTAQMGRWCREAVGTNIDWSSITAHLTISPSPRVLKILLEWGMPADIGHEGVGLLQKWIATDKHDHGRAMEILLDAGASGAVDATGLDAHQWLSALRITGATHQAVSPELEARLLSLHEHRLLTSQFPDSAPARAKNRL